MEQKTYSEAKETAGTRQRAMREVVVKSTGIDGPRACGAHGRVNDTLGI